MTTQTAMVSVTGNTYPVKDQLRALGGRWNGDQKAWLVPADKAAEAQSIVASVGPKKAFTGRSNYSGSRRYYGRNRDGECELCGKNKYTCGHCIGW